MTEQLVECFGGALDGLWVRIDPAHEAVVVFAGGLIGDSHGPLRRALCPVRYRLEYREAGMFSRWRLVFDGYHQMKQGGDSDAISE